MNLEAMISKHGLERIGFMTLTFAENVTDRAEAQRRYNSFRTNFLGRTLVEDISAVERQQRGALHYHLTAAFPFDLRTGFDFEACSRANACKKQRDEAGFRRWQAVYVRSANGDLREWWRQVREAAPRFGFGRCETLPVLSNSEGIARYVGAYVGSEAARREAQDRGLRTIRYGMAERRASMEWRWVGGASGVWRKGCQVLSALLGTEDFSAELGKRWAWHWRAEIAAFGRHWEQCLAAVSGVSDHYDFRDRCDRAAKLAEAIWEYEGSKS